MFMRFRGGGIGHVASRHWDAFLRVDGNDEKRGPETDRDGDEVDGRDAGNEDLEAEEDEVGRDNDSDSRNSGDDSDDTSDDDNEDSDDGGGAADDEDDDRVIADEGEELDDDVLVQEGYGAL